MSEKLPAVAVLMGGRSAEREISLVTGEQVASGLRQAGFDVVTIDTGSPDFLTALQECGADVAFICLHGRFGEDGTVQGLLELIDMPYVGSGVLASALAMDKAMCKAVFLSKGIPTPAHVCYCADEIEDVGAARFVAESDLSFGPPWVVKPVREGSALGVTICRSKEEVPVALEEALSFDRDVLIEEFVEGVEVTVGVLGTGRSAEALPTLEIVPEHDFYDFESKYEPGMSEHIIPARISEAAQRKCEEAALAAHRAIGCRGVSRVDLIVAPDDQVFVLEVNTIPGMTPTSLLPDAARAAGIGFSELCARLVRDAMSDA